MAGDGLVGEPVVIGNAEQVSPFKFYDVAILKEKIGPIGPGLVTPAEAGAGHPSHFGPKLTVAHLLTVFKGENARHIPK